VLEQFARAHGIDLHSAEKIIQPATGVGEVDQIGKILGNLAEIARFQIAGYRADTGVIHIGLTARSAVHRPGALFRTGKPGEAPHFIIGGKKAGNLQAHKTTRSGDENFLSRQHGNLVKTLSLLRATI